MILMILYELVEWVLADNIRIEDEEKALSVVLANYFLCQSDGSRSAHRFAF